MIDLQAYLEKRLREIIGGWDEDDIFAISFFVYSNEDYEYRGFSNVSTFSVSYNTERHCAGAGALSEERWNYAFWPQNETAIIDADDENEGMKILFDWYEEKGIENIGYEDHESAYDEEMNYIGKGPVGYYELLSEVSALAGRLQKSGFIKEKFDRTIPIIVHDLEYPWYVMEATATANPNGEADSFLAAMKELGYWE